MREKSGKSGKSGKGGKSGKSGHQLPSTKVTENVVQYHPQAARKIFASS
tara:strand:- start:621 stop:767 length:147 start_codon:yes stop_codon:yes gene_type:complete